MKDQYVADVNDYLKYSLLRALAGTGGELAVVWMLTRSDHRADGQRLGYLGQPRKYHRLDPDLFSMLKRLVELGERHVQGVEQAGVLPDAVFVSEVLEDDLPNRRRYFAQAWQISVGRALVFLDPDNGLAVPSVPKGRRNSAKYLYWDELEAVYARGQSLIVYQHFPRRPRGVFIRELADRVHDLTGCRRVLALVTSHVAFVVVPQRGDEERLVRRLNDFSAHAAPYATTVVSIKT